MHPVSNFSGWLKFQFIGLVLLFIIIIIIIIYPRYLWSRGILEKN